LKFAKLAAAAKDSVVERTRAESFAGMEKKYNYERITAENEHLIIRNQRYTIEVIIALLICTIITAFYLIEHNRKKKHMLLEENLRKTVAAKDKFFSIISHDLSNPFKALNRVSGLLYEQYPGMNETERLNAVRAINDTAGQAEKLLENLLLWSLTQKNDIPYRPRNIDLTDQLNSSIDLFVLTAQKKDIHLINSITESYSIEADPNMMSTILGNLIGNAIKFSYQDNKVIISAKDCGNLIEISVSDTGTGMSMEDQQRLFRLDTKIKQSGTQNEQGTGLGLILCREFIEKQGGKIWVESKLGKGTTFIFTVLKATDHETN
jgi:signal transduction histidine kinase